MTGTNPLVGERPGISGRKDEQGKSDDSSGGGGLAFHSPATGYRLVHEFLLVNVKLPE